MHVVQVNVVQPRDPISPETLLAAWSTLGDVAAAVRGAGHRVTVVQAFHCAAKLVRDGVRFDFVAEPRLPGRATGLMPRRIAQAVKAAAPDIVHVNGLDFARHTRALCRLGVPVLAQDHASAPGSRRALRKWGLARVAGISFTDARQATPFIAEGSIRAAVPIFSVPESSTHFTPGDQAEARRVSGMRGDPAILWVGRLDRNKDPLTILDAVEKAASHLPDLQFWACFHESQLLADVKARIARSPALLNRVHLVGMVSHDRIEQLCRAADLFVLGSKREGSGYALIEALACGATPVVSDIPSFRALTDKGRIGALAPVGDAAAFARAIVEQAGRPRAQSHVETIAHFERHLSFDALGRRLSEVYQSLVAATP